MTRPSDLNIEGAATTEGIPVAPLAPEKIAEARVPIDSSTRDATLGRRTALTYSFVT
jgi:hypothetical protein